MAVKQHKQEEIVTKLRQIDLLLGHGEYWSMRFCNPPPNHSATGAYHRDLGMGALQLTVQFS